MKHRLNILLIVSALSLLSISAMAEDTNVLATLQASFRQQDQALMDGHGTALGWSYGKCQAKAELDFGLQLRGIIS